MNESLVFICDASSPESTASSDSQAETDSWILSIIPAEIQSRGAANPSGLTIGSYLPSEESTCQISLIVLVQRNATVHTV